MKIGRTLVGAITAGAAVFGITAGVQAISGSTVALVAGIGTILIAMPAAIVWINR